MKPGNRWFFILLFFIMIVFLMNLDKLMKERGYTNNFYFSEVDSSKILNQPIDIISESLYFKIHIKGNKNKYLFFNNSVKIKVKLLSSNIDTIKLNLTKNWKIKCDDSDFEFYHKNDILYIPIAPLPPSNGEYTFDFSFSGRPIQYHPWCNGLSYKFLIDSLNIDSGRFMLSTISVPFGAHTWFICKDDPGDKIDSLSITLNVPEQLIALANGKLIKTEYWNDRVEYSYKLHSPVAPHLVGIFIGPYKKWEFNYQSDFGNSMPVQLFTFDEVKNEELIRIQDRILYIIDFFEDVLNEYPYSSDGLKIIQHLMNGGMEIQTSIGVSEISLRNEFLYVHEIAHQWVGNQITSPFSDAWLSEGLTTYLTAMYIEKVIGEKEFYNYMVEKKNVDEHSLIVKDIFSPDSLFNEYTYNKGAWIIHMMRKIMGDVNFGHFLKSWVKQDQLQLYNTTHFFEMANKIFPYDWKNFKEYWVNKGEIPQLIYFSKKGSKFFKLQLDNYSQIEIPVILNHGGKNIQKTLNSENAILLNKIIGKKYPEEILKDFLCTLKYE